MTIRNEILQQLCGAKLRGATEGLTDGQLLGHFLEHKDETAIAALVRRHGPMVWGVCRRRLGNLHDAEDAFQATFLVLVRRAASIRPREKVGNWLYGVAHHTTCKAQATLARRRTREKQVMGTPEPALSTPEREPELLMRLDQEVNRLPGRYRTILVLCDLEGRTRKEVARQLGLAEGTVASRLARARALLAERLRRTGVVVSTAGIVAVLTERASATVPTSTAAATVLVSALLSGGARLATVVSPRVLSLTEGVLRAMMLAKLRLSALVMVLAGLVLGGGLLARPMLIAQQSAPEQAMKPPAKDPRSVPEASGKSTDKSDSPAAADEAGAGPFKINIVLQKGQALRVNAVAEVSARVTNISKTTQTFQVMSGSYDGHWTCNNARLFFYGQLAVFRNLQETISLEPGQSYVKPLHLGLKPGEPVKQAVFKMGFTPTRSKETYWSAEIGLPVEE